MMAENRVLQAGQSGQSGSLTNGHDSGETNNRHTLSDDPMAWQNREEGAAQILVNCSDTTTVQGRSPNHYQSERRGSASSGPDDSSGTLGKYPGQAPDYSGELLFHNPSCGTQTGYETRPLYNHDTNLTDGYHYYPGAIYEGFDQWRSRIPDYPPNDQDTTMPSLSRNTDLPIPRLKQENESQLPILQLPSLFMPGSNYREYERMIHQSSTIELEQRDRAFGVPDNIDLDDRCGYDSGPRDQPRQRPMLLGLVSSPDHEYEASDSPIENEGLNDPSAKFGSSGTPFTEPRSQSPHFSRQAGAEGDVSHARSGTTEEKAEKSKTQPAEDRELQPRQRRPLDHTTLPPGWFIANEPSGGHYFYTKSGVVQWHKPTVPAPGSSPTVPASPEAAPRTPQPSSNIDSDVSNNSGSHLDSIRVPVYTATDSGYGSLSTFQRVSNAPDAVRNEAETYENFPNTSIPTASSEVGTVFSAASTMVPEIVSDSVTQICEGIAQDLQLELDTNSLGAIVGNIGEVIKAFAIQLGLDQSLGMSPSIMYFVYKHHHAICTLLKEKIMEEDDDQKDSKAGKMALWYRGSSRRDFDSKESFEGVDDLEDDDPMSTMELSAYSKLILQSPAYRWLISTLKSQASLSHGDGRATMASDEIRRTVSKQLQTGTISTNRPPSTFTTSFVLPGYRDILKARLYHDILPGTSGKLENATVLVASSKADVQLCTVGHYMYQVWRESGTLLLKGFQDFMDANNDDACATVQGQDHLKIKVYSVDGDIRATCSGSSYLVSQCAAQIAWISCALRSGGSRPLVGTPQLIQTDVAEFAVSHLEETAERQSILAHVEIAGQLRPVSIDEQVSVWGFPTALRPESFSGVEIPLDLTHDSVNSFFQESYGHLIFNIGGNIAYFVDRKNDIWLWHLAPSLEEVCSCVPGILDRSARIATPRGSKVYDFFQNRHIFSRCYQSRRSFQDCMTRLTQEEETDLDRGEDRTMIKSPGWGSLQSDFPTKHSTEFDSIDTDLLSISSFSCDNEDSARELHGYMAVIVESTAQDLFSSFQQSLASTDAPCEEDSAENSDGNTPSYGQILPERSTNSGLNPGKRKANDRDEEDGDASQQNRRPEKQSKTEKSSSQRHFACPFWKFDPVKHRKCLRFKLLDTSRVKQHLNRNHIPVYYCQACFAIFEEQQTHEQHVLGHSCVRLPGAQLDGLLPEQQKSLSRKTRSKEELSAEQKWYRIWTVVFPEHPLPRSPYIDSWLEDELAYFRERCLALGPEMLETRIQSSGISLNSTVEQSQLLRSVLRRGLEMICDSWLPAQRNSSLQIPVTPAYTQEQSSRATLSSTTTSSSSAGASMNFRGTIHTNPTRRTIGQTGSAIADSSIVDQVGANTTSASLNSMLPELDSSAAMQTHAPLRDPDDFFSAYDAAFPHESGHSAADFEDILNWPNP